LAYIFDIRNLYKSDFVRNSMKKGVYFNVALAVFVSLILINFAFALDLPAPPGSPQIDSGTNATNNATAGTGVQNNIPASGDQTSAQSTTSSNGVAKWLVIGGIIIAAVIIIFVVYFILKKKSSASSISPPSQNPPSPPTSQENINPPIVPNVKK
jgi:hypothetical protein